MSIADPAFSIYVSFYRIYSARAFQKICGEFKLKEGLGKTGWQVISIATWGKKFWGSIAQ